ncbi:hypothetical protein E3E12_03000 [Formicincola oecophyllae]|uniref:Tetratricopeptide repeat protein n=1 Tax=Formicincola oecophyllae TaxID=2558361 RepID=A0A4Y6U7G6_9PROT|nr:hypothetical protein [Formicincola oecophyllae]QDH13339.1 hypothetical protein E3E12_03000 [Formicincola oecophyllae]
MKFSTTNWTVALAMGAGLAAMAPHSAAWGAEAAAAQGARLASGATLSPDVSKDLLAAQAELKAGHFQEAMNAVAHASHAPNQTKDDRATIVRMGAAIAMRSGNVHASARTAEALAADPALPATERARALQDAVVMAYRAHDWPTAAALGERYFNIPGLAQAGSAGQRKTISSLLVQSYYVPHHWAGVVMATDQLAKTTPGGLGGLPENLLQMRAAAYGQMNNHAGQQASWVVLAEAYHRPAYWQAALAGLEHNSDLSPYGQYALQKLRFAAGLVSQPAAVRDLEEQAIQLGLPAAALRLENAANARHIQPLPDAARFNAFLKRRLGQAVPDQNPVLAAGEAVLAAAPAQQGAALATMKARVAAMPTPENQLAYGLVLADIGRSHEAQQALGQVKGPGAVHDLAQMWRLTLHTLPAH